jgi:hypothetical protein
MSVARCSRCLRQQPEEEEAAGRRAPGSIYAAWASLHGEIVCPQCQDPAERRESLQRIVSRYVAEMERRERAGVPTDSIEAALGPYILGLRDALEASIEAHEDADRDPAEASEQATPGVPVEGGGTTGGTELAPEEPIPHGGEAPPAAVGEPWKWQVAITGAFLTGTAVNVAIDEYEWVQKKLLAALCCSTWTDRGLDRPGGTYESGGGFSKAMPLVIVRREAGLSSINSLTIWTIPTTDGGRPWPCALPGTSSIRSACKSTCTTWVWPS